jgi:hypothetical protein
MALSGQRLLRTIFHVAKLQKALPVLINLSARHALGLFITADFSLVTGVVTVLQTVGLHSTTVVSTERMTEHRLQPIPTSQDLC